MTNSSLAQICKQLNSTENIAVFCHARPDGDALGAGLSLMLALQNAGKKVVMCCEDTPSEKFTFLPETALVKNQLPAEIIFDTFISVDCADVFRLGSFTGAFQNFKGKTVNIDHHFSNKRFAELNYVIDCPATCELLYEILEFAGFEISNEIANLLMLGLICDSGNFSHNDVTEKTFAVAAKLRSYGADVNLINYNVFSKQTKFRALLFGKIMSGMRFALDDRLAFIVIPSEELKSVEDKNITEGFVDFPLTVDGVEVSVSMLEVKKRQYKISLRSKGKVNVNAVAAAFGGGGHILASGCMLSGDKEEVIDKITYAVYQNL